MITPAAAAPLPRLSDYPAPAGWRSIDFLSDLHLQGSTPRSVEALARHLEQTSADAVFVLGDLFEAWPGDDARFDGFEQQCAAMLREAAARKTVGFMCGNRDFLVGTALLQDCGILALPDPTVLIAFGRRILLIHGDALCLADHDYQRFRTQVRNPAWQAGFLAKPLSERRAIAQQMRAQSEQHKRELGRDSWIDLDRDATLQWMEAAGTPTLIHGHTHHPSHEQLAPGRERWVLSDWDLDHEPRRADVLRLDAAGIRRIDIATPA